MESETQELDRERHAAEVCLRILLFSAVGAVVEVVLVLFVNQHVLSTF